QTQREPVEDREAKRRRYLVRKATANTLAFIGCGTAFCFVLLAVFFAVPFLFLLFLSMNRGGLDAGFAAGYVFGLLVLVGLASLGGRLYRTSEQAARFMPYVPPVDDQVAALPAEEVLVRGSAEPTDPSKELLRAAHEGAA